MDIICGALITIVSLGLTAMFYGYKMKMDKKSVKLEKNDQKGDHEHKQNCQRIEELEKKNGDEQKQINELKEQLVKKDNKYKKLKGDIRLIKALMTLSTEERIKEIRRMEQENDTDDEDWDDDNEK